MVSVMLYDAGVCKLLLHSRSGNFSGHCGSFGFANCASIYFCPTPVPFCDLQLIKSLIQHGGMSEMKGHISNLNGCHQIRFESKQQWTKRGFDSFKFSEPVKELRGLSEQEPVSRFIRSFV